MADELTAYDEVVTHDCYRLRSLPFLPATVYDLGAHKGHFAEFAASLWPEARIVSVEPHSENFRELQRRVAGKNVIVVNAAIPNGCGVLFEGENSLTHRYSPPVCSETGLCGTISFCHLLQMFPPTLPWIVKCDIEGAEQYEAWAELKDADYWTMELHFKTYDLPQDCLTWIRKMSVTHTVTVEFRRDKGRDGAMVWATRHSK